MVVAQGGEPRSRPRWACARSLRGLRTGLFGLRVALAAVLTGAVVGGPAGCCAAALVHLLCYG